MNNLKIRREQLDAERELARQIECPRLTDVLIETVTKTIFIPSNPQKSELLFVFGSSYGDKWEEVAALYHKGFAPVVYIAGGLVSKSSEVGKIISHDIRDRFVFCGVPKESIIVDEQSTNTLEDAVFGQRIFIQKKISHKRILFACKAPHSGRCLRTLKKVFPESQLFPFTYEFIHKGKTITSINWFADESARQTVWAEYQRIQLYASRGDICS